MYIVGICEGLVPVDSVVWVCCKIVCIAWHIFMCPIAVSILPLQREQGVCLTSMARLCL